jgi:putative transposase
LCDLTTGGWKAPEPAGRDACHYTTIVKPEPSSDPDPPHLTVGFHSRDHLPHLKKEGGTYFVTFRLAGTLPREVLLQLKLEREQILQHALATKRLLTWAEQEELFRWYSERVDAYLDAGHGECLLRHPEIAKLVSDALALLRRAAL